MAVLEALRTSALCKGFTETGLQILAGITVERTFPKGAPLFVENMVGDSLFILAEGQVRIQVRGQNGEDVPLGELRKGDSLGELSLLQQGQRLCTAVALTPVTALELRAADFQRLMSTKPQACLKLLMAIVTQFGAKLQGNREAFRALLATRGCTPRS